MTSTDTTTTAEGGLPAAWYPDPSGRHQLRWWDGERWSHRVADGNEVSSDPPVRHVPAQAAPQPTPEPDPEPTPVAEVPSFGSFEPDPEPAPAAGEPAREASADPLAGFDQLKRDRRQTTAVASQELTKRQALMIGIACAVVTLLSLGWGFVNHSSASRWQERGEELQAELDRQASNGDALEQAIGNAASRTARLQDGQALVAEIQEAAKATVDQLYACARALNAVLVTASQSAVDRANQICNTAAYNGEGLIAVLEELQAG